MDSRKIEKLNELTSEMNLVLKRIDALNSKSIDTTSLERALAIVGKEVERLNMNYISVLDEINNLKAQFNEIASVVAKEMVVSEMKSINDQYNSLRNFISDNNTIFGYADTSNRLMDHGRSVHQPSYMEPPRRDVSIEDRVNSEIRSSARESADDRRYAPVKEEYNEEFYDDDDADTDSAYADAYGDSYEDVIEGSFGDNFEYDDEPINYDDQSDDGFIDMDEDDEPTNQNVPNSDPRMFHTEDMKRPVVDAEIKPVEEPKYVEEKKHSVYESSESIAAMVENVVNTAYKKPNVEVD